MLIVGNPPLEAGAMSGRHGAQRNAGTLICEKDWLAASAEIAGALADENDNPRTAIPSGPLGTPTSRKHAAAEKPEKTSTLRKNRACKGIRLVSAEGIEPSTY